MDAPMRLILLWFLFVLTACVDPDKSRSYDEFVSDYNRIKGISSNNTNGPTNNSNSNNQTNSNNPNNPVIAPVPCSFNGVPINVEFVNRSGVTADLYWVNSDCDEFRYATLAPNQSHPQSTFIGHVWVLREGETALGWVRVLAGGDGIFELGQ